MRATAFRIQNYRNVKDSGWIELDRVTALVGRNESGKTALLKALHKFNPSTPEPYDGQRDFPRDRYTTEFRNPADWPVCSVRFAIEGAVMEELAGILGDRAAVPQAATCTRFYDGHLKVTLEPAVPTRPVPVAPVLDALDTFSKAARRLAAPSPDAEEATQAERTRLLEWASGWREKLTPVCDLRGESGVGLLKALKKDADKRSGPQTADMMDDLAKTLDTTLDEAGRSDPAAAATAAVERAMPVFIYFENYGILDSAVWLSRFIEDAKGSPNDSRVRTINAMFRHVGLSAEDLQALGGERAAQARQQGRQVTNEMTTEDQRRKEERAIKLSSASGAITRMFSDWWSQRRHRIRYDADGDFFRIWVSDDRRPDVEIELESRSKGFQWFFSFYLVFLVESDDGHKNAMLLLDEPGLHLHPTAQQELIAFFDNLSRRNQLVYSTHSPFLIDGKNLQRVRPVVEGADGQSHVSPPGMWPKDRETIFPLQAAAGYAMLRGLLTQHDNVLVEGMTDYYILHALSDNCRKAGLETMPEGMHIVPCGGVPMVGKLASLFLGEGTRAIVLLDGDKAGREARTSLYRDLYRGQESAVLLLDDVLGGSDMEIEDIVGEEAFVAATNAALGLAVKVEPEDRNASGLPKTVAAAARRLGVPLPDGWKVTAVLYLVRDWAEGRTEPTADALQKAAILFKALRRTKVEQP